MNIEQLVPQVIAPYLSFCMNAQRERFDHELHAFVGKIAVGQDWQPEVAAALSSWLLTRAQGVDEAEALQSIVTLRGGARASLVVLFFDMLADGAQDNAAAVDRMSEALRLSVGWLPNESVMMVAVFAEHDRVFVPKLAWELLGAALIARAQVTRCPVYSAEVNALLREFIDCMRDPAREFESDARLAEFGRRGLAGVVLDVVEWWDSFAHLLGGEVGLESAPSKLARERRNPT